MTLPSWAAEMEETKTLCRNCGDKLTVATALGYWLGDNGSYFCAADTDSELPPTVLHEPRGN
jgi:hypothetical protein